MELEVVKRFLNKPVGVVRDDNGRDFFSRGTLTEVTPSSIVLERDGVPEAIALDSIRNIRILDGNGGRAT